MSGFWLLKHLIGVHLLLRILLVDSVRTFGCSAEFFRWSFFFFWPVSPSF
jgi:hypothetical protein